MPREKAVVGALHGLGWVEPTEEEVEQVGEMMATEVGAKQRAREAAGMEKTEVGMKQSGTEVAVKRRQLATTPGKKVRQSLSRGSRTCLDRCREAWHATGREASARVAFCEARGCRRKDADGSERLALSPYSSAAVATCTNARHPLIEASKFVH